MTVRLLVQYGKFPPNTNFSGGAAVEAELLRTFQADTNTAVGVTFVDPVPTERAGPVAMESTGGVDLLKADGRTLANLTQIQALVSGDGSLSDGLGRPVTELRGDRVLSYSYGADYSVKRIKVAGKNYKVALGAKLLDFADPADVARTSFANTNATSVIAAPPVARVGITQGVRVVTGTAAADRGTATAINMTSIPVGMLATDFLLIPVYVEQCNSTDQIIVFLSPDNNSSTSVSFTAALNQNKLGWFDLFVPLSLFGGSSTIGAAHNSIRVQVKHANAGGVPTIATVFGPVLNPKQVGRVMVDFDDGFLSQYTEVFKYMQTKGLVGDIAVCGEVVGKSAGQFDAYDYMSLAQAKEIHAAGWGMCTHGYYPHNQGGTLDSDPAKILADVLKNKNFLIDNGMTGNEQHYMYVAGQVVTAGEVSYNAMRAAGMSTARGTMNNLINTSEYGIDQRLQLFSLSLSAQTGLAALQTALTRVVDSGGVQIFCGHRVTAGAAVDLGNEISRADWRAFVDDLAAKRDAGLLDVVTRQQWYAGLAS